MTNSIRGLDPGQQTDHPLKFYQILMAAAGVSYLVWWQMVELFLPGSFNPIGSRLAVVLFCLGLYGASFLMPLVSRNVEKWLSACLWVITIHVFYLFHHNQADINWVVGSYITVMAVCACLQSESALVSYSVLVLILSVFISLRDGALLKTIFLPGMITILTFAYVGLRSRLRWLARSRETSQWLQNLFDAVFEGIVVHDQGRIVDANESFASLFGYRVDELIGMKIADFVPERVEGSSEAPYEATGIQRNGSVVPLEIREKEHLVGGRRLKLVTVDDITVRKKSEQDRVLVEASEKAIRMRDEFLSVASHELKTPLTNVKLQTQMAMRGIQKDGLGVLSPEKIRSFIEQTDRQADRLTRLVDEMLDVSKVSSGRLEIVREEFDLVDLVREVSATFEAALRNAGSSLEIEVTGSSRIFADRFRIGQVISNLLSNAVKYGNRKPIRIGIETLQAEVRLIFEDQGMGILKEDHERIFERFERATPSTKISGLGLGLYITKTIVDSHDGRIEVESELDQGSRFTVILPLLAAGS